MRTPKEAAQHLIDTTDSKEKASDIASMYIMNNSGKNQVSVNYWTEVRAEIKKLN